MIMASRLQAEGDSVEREQDDQVDLLVVPKLVDQPLDAVFPDAERQVGHEAAGVGDGGVRKRLADDADPRAADPADRAGIEWAGAPPDLPPTARGEVPGQHA